VRVQPVYWFDSSNSPKLSFGCDSFTNPCWIGLGGAATDLQKENVSNSSIVRIRTGGHENAWNRRKGRNHEIYSSGSIHYRTVKMYYRAINSYNAIEKFCLQPNSVALWGVDGYFQALVPVFCTHRQFTECIAYCIHWHAFEWPLRRTIKQTQFKCRFKCRFKWLQRFSWRQSMTSPIARSWSSTATAISAQRMSGDFRVGPLAGWRTSHCTIRASQKSIRTW